MRERFHTFLFRVLLPIRRIIEFFFRIVFFFIGITLRLAIS